MGADNPGWVASQAGAVRALPVGLTLMGRARARKHDTDFSNRLTDQAFDLPGRDAVLTIIGLQNAGKLPYCGAAAREQVIDLAGAGAGDAGIGTVILIGDHEYVCEDRGARRVRDDPLAPVNLAGEMRAMGAHGAGGLTDGAHDHQSPDRCADAPHSARFGDGGGIVIRLPGRVLTGGRAAAIVRASGVPGAG